MQVKLIQAYLAHYLRYLRTDHAHEADALAVWETQANWQANFATASMDLAAAYATSLTSQTSRRHYSRSGFAPREFMLALLAWEPAFVRDAFVDLFDEQRSLDGRVQRFELYLDELLARYREAFPKKDIPSHYHDDDYGMVSLYLALQYPETYAPYSTPLLQDTLRKFGAANPPLTADLPRYVKLLRTADQFIAREEKIQAAHRARLREGTDYPGPTKLLAWDFLRFVQRNNQVKP
ncbi:MAG: hypothetical protein WBA17_13675 [Saprospiraceae bacterium]